jgi:uncharacterized protein
VRDATEIVAELDLEEHPEGGWFRRFWQSPLAVETPRGERSLVTSIHYLLSAGQQSQWHRIHGSQETWVWQDGGDLVLSTGGTGRRPQQSEEFHLGSASLGMRTQAIIEPSQWQMARVAAGDWVLVACFVSPGFDFADWEMPQLD